MNLLFPTIGSALFIRIILPALSVFIFFSPILHPLFLRIFPFEHPLLESIYIGFLIPSGIICFSFIIHFSSSVIYQIYLGLLFWPNWLIELRLRALNNRIVKKQEKLNSTTKHLKKRKLIAWLIRFPRKEKDNEQYFTEEVRATLPTVLGNIMTSYDNYPKDKYNLHSFDNWAVLDLIMTDENRKRVNTIWAEADSLVFLSFIFLITGIAYFLLFILEHIMNLKLINSEFVLLKWILESDAFFFILLSTFIFSYFIYRVALTFHFEKGKYFRALFDKYHKEIEKIKNQD